MEKYDLEMEKYDRLQVTMTPCTSLDIRESLDIPASLGTPASLDIPAIREDVAVLALPGTPINPPMDAENKDSKAKADAVLATTQQAAPKRRLKRKTTVQE